MNRLNIRGISKLPRPGVVIAAIFFVVAASAAVVFGDMAMMVTAPDKIKWIALDPNAGDKGPMVAVVFGDLSKKGPLGRIVRLPAGIDVGMHTHKTDGWVVVLQGKHHHFGPGQDQGKPVAWWFQPAHGVHDDVCEKGVDCLLFAYTPGGADFIPTDANYKEPAGIPKMKVTYQGDVKYSPIDPNAGDKGPQRAVAYGDLNKAETIGFFLKIPPGFKPGPHTHSSDDYAVGISGSMHNFAAGSPNMGPSIGTGGMWYQPANVPHDNSCEGSAPCIFFLHLPGGADFIPVK